MIVMLALLNDGAILSIAYDKVHYKNQPEAWNMRVVLGVSTVLGAFGVVAAFGLFYLGERVFHLDRAHIQTLMYLKLSVAGHLTIFLTRTRGPFWSIRPARILMDGGVRHAGRGDADRGLRVVHDAARLGLGAFVWGYALAWFLVNDRVKLLAYRIFDPESKPSLGRKHTANPSLATRQDPGRSPNRCRRRDADDHAARRNAAGRPRQMPEKRRRVAWRNRRKKT